MTDVGYIYLLRDAGDRPYYIGQTVDTARREREHRTPQNGRPAKLHPSGRMDVIETVECSRIDAREQELIAEYRERGYRLENVAPGGGVHVGRPAPEPEPVFWMNRKAEPEPEPDPDSVSAWWGYPAHRRNELRARHLGIPESEPESGPTSAWWGYPVHLRDEIKARHLGISEPAPEPESVADSDPFALADAQTASFQAAQRARYQANLTRTRVPGPATQLPAFDRERANADTGKLHLPARMRSWPDAWLPASERTRRAG